MRLERLSNNKIKVSISKDDLFERGLSIDDVSHDSLKWQQLFHDMLEEANDEFGVEIVESVTIEIFTLQSQGLVLIATLDEQSDNNDFVYIDNLFNVHVFHDEEEQILFKFDCFENVIQLAHRLIDIGAQSGSLYKKDSFYYLYFNYTELNNYDIVSAILYEYGERALESVYFIEEYGKKIIDKNAIKIIVHYFKQK